MESEPIPLYQQKSTLPPAEGCVSRRDIQVRSELQYLSPCASAAAALNDDSDDDDIHNDDHDNDDGEWTASHTQSTRSSSKRESPKVVLGRSRTRAVQHFLLFHIIPISGALGLIVLNVTTKFYTGDPAWIPLLQFVAKVHESLIVLSIVVAMLTYLQYLLIHRRAVPFGSIFFAHQMAHMVYLVSPEFWATLTAPEFSLLMKVVFAIAVIFSVLLASVVGPSSAIAMQPRMTNYSPPDWSGFGVDASSDYLFPNVLKNVTSTAIGETSQVGVQYQTNRGGRPIMVMPTLYSSTILERSSALDPFLYKYAMGSRTMYLQYAPNATIATIPQIFATSSLLRAYNYFPGQPTGMFYPSVISTNLPQAYVSTVCELNTIMGEDDNRPIHFPDSYFADFFHNETSYLEKYPVLNVPNTTDRTTISRKNIFEQNIQSRRGRIIWVDGGVEVASPIPGATPAAIVVHPEPCRSVNGSVFLSVSACVLGAQWANTTVTYTRTKQYDERGKLENELTPESLVFTPSWRNTSQLINMPAEWTNTTVGLTRIFNLTQDTDRLYHSSSIEPIRIENAADKLLKSLPMTDIICLVNGTYSGNHRPVMHEAVLSTLVANAISYHHCIVEPSFHWSSGWRPAIYDSGSSIPTEPPKTTFTFRYVKSGYAWTMQGTSIKLSIAILGLYCVFGLTYGAFSLISKRSSLAWASISGLVTLAMNSTPTKSLKNTGAGVGTTDIFRRLVNVKERGSSRKIELVFEKDVKEDQSRDNIVYSDIIAGRAYS
ncbi:hypothetical protein TEQG_01575 [Trichophyton equinum CBS 127.97]|uniref:Uncharacterized protein n=1 Tax=Trichophyton equinum (strain ATCC MYA-4606 / CBS 127.97) TaxID=559882 RepID=F2PLH6_TRIEC|nr:hypothetical protein TEQG_01575 [Trichophyton equinum CBS 127.97]